MELDAENERVKFMFSRALEVGHGVLKMKFQGELNNKMKGFYRSKYKTSDGEERFNAVTQFAPTDARRCFPCWDEPAIKSTFDLTLTSPKNRISISNTPVVSKEACKDEDTHERITFQTTPIMSTYLLAFVVGEFEFVEGFTSDSIQCRVYTPLGRKEQGQFALDVCTRVIPYYSNYFGIPYPLNKIDLIAVPDCFYGAMENWGLLIYRETALLVDKVQSSALQKEYVALVVGHEIAHQWFGNLVTMDWWTHLWLNEGYASFVEFMCVAELFPEYDIWTQFVTDTHNPALELDALDNSHPIEVPVNHPSEIDEIFDTISYLKGASIIQMLHHFIGDESFRKGMNIYLERHQYKTASTEDLWQALGEASNINVAEVMGGWTGQMGYPLIRVTNWIQYGDTCSLTLSQGKFCANRESGLSGQSTWQVPLSFSKVSSPNDVFHKELMTHPVIVVRLNCGSEDFVKINPSLYGFYRVQYPAEVLAKFVPSILNMRLPPLDRLGLLDDAFALAKSGQSPTKTVLELLNAFRNEENYTVWSTICKIITTIHSLLGNVSNQDIQIKFANFAKGILRGITDKVGWEAQEGEGHLRALLRTLILNEMVSLGDEETLSEANLRFKTLNTGKPLLPDLRTPIFKGVLSLGDESTLKTFMEMYTKADSQEEQVRIARAFSAIKDTMLLKQIAEFAMSDGVRKQDTVIMLASIGISKDGRHFVWDLFKSQWKLFQNEYVTNHVAKMLKLVLENFAHEPIATDIEVFFRENTYRGTEMSIKQAVEKIRLNDSWLHSDIGEIENFLSKAP